MASNISFQANIARQNGTHEQAINYYDRLQAKSYDTEKVQDENAWSKFTKALGNGAKELTSTAVESFAKSAAEELIRSAAMGK